jgi:hypothetical protein
MQKLFGQWKMLLRVYFLAPVGRFAIQKIEGEAPGQVRTVMCHLLQASDIVTSSFTPTSRQADLFLR